ncbi:MAG: carboxypeptidase regulatory-like domain-containing protein [Acidobacteria bacterium]|nr:carboxypeptidase regulatory-like domain-containing protein [Acidobacteriota bacterium]
MHSRIWSLAAAVVLAAATQAQTSRGTVSGTVLDPSGAVVTGAAVVLTHAQTGVRRLAHTNEAGIYRFDAVDLGVYELKIAHTGFKGFVATGVGVQANLTTTIDPRLELGAAEVAVQVSADGEAVMVRDSPLRGGNFVPRQVSQLPLIGRNPISLARTLPGVIQVSGSSQQTRDGTRSAEFAVNGQRVRSNNYRLTGPRTTTSASVAWPSRLTWPTPSRRSRCRPATSAWSSGAPRAESLTWSPSLGRTRFTAQSTGDINRSASTPSPTSTS